MIDKLKSGAWLTPQRLKVYPAMLLVAVVLVMVGLIATSQGWLDRSGKPLGTDFSSFWAAGSLALKGQPDAAYDHQRHHAEQKATFDNDAVPFYGWLYPPLFLMLVAVLALMPYPVALFVWMAATLAAYLAVLRRIAPYAQTTILALAFPAVFVNLGHGQNAFLTTALFGGALLVLDRRPVLAGILVGCLAYKPHFGLLIPLVLAATGRWRTFVSASVTVVGLVGISTALFGTKTWLAMIESTGYTRKTLLETGNVGWEKIQSLFAALRHLGLSVDLSYIAQGALALVVVVATVWIWRSRADFALKAAALATGTLLVTPFLLDYDMMVLALALAWFSVHGLKHGFLPWEKTILATVWVTPLIARSVMTYVPLPLGFLAMAALFVLILHRASRDIAAPME